MVLGCAGTGKTRLSRRLADRLAIPLIDLDALWASKAIAGDLAAFRAAMAAAHSGDAWVSDGNFAIATFDLRLPRADLIVWLDAPQWLRLWRAGIRVTCPGEAHRLADLPKVLAFIRNFDRVNRPLIETEIARHGPNVPLRMLKGRREVDSFLEGAG